MTIGLLDMNVLVALVDPAHVQHEQAHDWFARVGTRGFATCPITENGLLRIVGHPRYPNSQGTPAMVMESLTALRALENHHFWPDDISLAGGETIDPTRLLSHAQVTDTYLLALAAAHAGKLISMDRKLVTDAVKGGRALLELI